jgi:hypothetical protein
MKKPSGAHGNKRLPIPAIKRDELTPRYDAACRALAEARSVNEILKIRDVARQIEACARIANNHEAEADCVALRMDATRKLGQAMKAQKDSGAGGGKKAGPRGSVVNPRDLRPTLASQKVGKRLAHDARVLGDLPQQDYEALRAARQILKLFAEAGDDGMGLQEVVAATGESLERIENMVEWLVDNGYLHPPQWQPKH